MWLAAAVAACYPLVAEEKLQRWRQWVVEGQSSAEEGAALAGVAEDESWSYRKDGLT